MSTPEEIHLRDGWLQRQTEEVRREVANWPECLKSLRFINLSITERYDPPWKVELELVGNDTDRPYPDGIAWDEAWRQRKRADAYEAILTEISESLRKFRSTPTAAGVLKYPPDGMRLSDPCTCLHKCECDCRGDCGCEACFQAYMDSLE